MELPRTAASPEGLTIDYEPGRSIGRLPLAVATGSGPATEDELRALLRRRLRFLCLLLASLYGVAAIRILSGGVPLAQSGLNAWSIVVAFLGTSLFAALVWSRRPLSLHHLRAIELVLVLIFAARIVFRGYVAFWHPVPQGEFETWRETGDKQVLQSQFVDSANFLCYAAAIFIIAYGICIPNTRRRCLVIVAALWSIAPAIWVIGLIDNDLVGVWFSQPTGLEGFMLLTVAGALAVYGSHRIETLRHAALQARRLGQYVLRKRLGGGGMGEVYLADHVLLRRPCAIKLIRPERAGDAEMLRRFEREVQATATLTHPNAVQIFDYGRAEDGTFYYVMEYLPGLTLEELVKQHGLLPPARVIHFLRQLCGALGEATPSASFIATSSRATS